MTLSADGRHWSVVGRLASNFFVREPKSQTASFGSVDLIIAAEEFTCEAVAQIVTRPVARKRRIVARLFSPLSPVTQDNVLVACSRWNADRSAPDAPSLALPLVVFAPSIEQRCLKVLAAASVRGAWSVVVFYYQTLNGYSNLVSGAERLIGRAPDLTLDSPMTACFMDLRSIGFVCGYEQAVLSMQYSATALLGTYPGLSRTYNPARVKEPW
jgi:hypothetical protein